MPPLITGAGNAATKLAVRAAAATLPVSMRAISLLLVMPTSVTACAAVSAISNAVPSAIGKRCASRD
jgi:hypothetical protein